MQLLEVGLVALLAGEPHRVYNVRSRRRALMLFHQSICFTMRIALVFRKRVLEAQVVLLQLVIFFLLLFLSSVFCRWLLFWLQELEPIQRHHALHLFNAQHHLLDRLLAFLGQLSELVVILQALDLPVCCGIRVEEMLVYRRGLRNLGKVWRAVLLAHQALGLGLDQHLFDLLVRVGEDLLPEGHRLLAQLAEATEAALVLAGVGRAPVIAAFLSW